MKFKTTQQPVNIHKQMVTAACWTPGNQLYTCGDDKVIMKWNLQGEDLGKVCDLDAFVTDMSWFPSAGQQTSDMFAVSCTGTGTGTGTGCGGPGGPGVRLARANLSSRQTAYF